MVLLKNIYIYINSLINVRYKGYSIRYYYYHWIKYLNKNITIKRNSLLIDKDSNFGNIDPKMGFLKINSLDNKLKSKLFKETKIIFEERKNNYYKNPRLKALIQNNEIKVESALYELATNKKIINTISNYLGVMPVCTYINLWYSPKKTDNELQGSQLMHLDHEDFHQIKLFFYCEDVDKETGPLVAINKEDSTFIQKKYKYNLKQKNKRINDDELKSFNFNYLTGKKGDMYLVDTSQCFHAGSRKSSKDRYLVMIQYLTPYSYMRKNKKNKLGFMFDKQISSNLEKKLFSFS